jgi:hypothetical protein
MIKTNLFESSNIAPSSKNWYRLYQIAAGAGILIIAGMLWMGFLFRIRWLENAALPTIGLLFLIVGWITQSFNKLIAGSLLFGIGLGFAAFLTSLYLTMVERVGLFGGFFGVGWLLVVLFSKRIIGKTAWWALIVAALSVGVGVVFSTSSRGLAAGIGVELALLALVLFAWGIVEQKNGLVIAAGNLFGLGLGFMFAWSSFFDASILSKFGVLLLGLAMGWVLIMFSSHFSGDVVLWWAMIPSGVMGIVGWGLYIGGRPFFSIEIIGNIGSIALIAIGLYLLLLRSGMHK